MAARRCAAGQAAVPTGRKQSYLSWSRGSGAGMGRTENVGGAQVSGVQRGMAQEQKVVRSIAQAEQTPSVYAVGDHVRHRKFGTGVVIRVRGTGADARVLVRFDDAGVGAKEIAASIAPMIRIGG